MRFISIILILFMCIGTINTVSALYETDITWNHLSSKNGDIPDPGIATQQTASLIVDVDRDGLNDFIIGSRDQGPSLVWFKRDSAGWNKYLIESGTLPIEAGGTFYDIDGDGDQDIILGGDWQSNKIWWWENPYPEYSPDKPWVRHEIKNSGDNQHHDQIFGDFDGDGQAELVSWNQFSKNLLLFEIPADAKTRTTPWPGIVIYTWAGVNPEGLDMADIDGDGTQDIIGGGMWFKYTGGSNPFTANIIDVNSRMTRVVSGQWKKGGAPEVVFSGGDNVGPLTWYEYDRTTKIWTGHDLLGYDLRNAHSLQMADINADGNLDLFAAEMTLKGITDAKAFILYGDGNGGILSNVTLSTGIDNHESKVADLDGNGNLDILSKPYNGDTPRVDVWLQKAAISLGNWEYRQVDATREKYSDSWYSYFGLSASDATGDHCKDIISGKYFYKNPGCSNISSSWVRSEMPVDSDGALFADVDGNSNADVIAFGLPYVYWFEISDANIWTLKRTITLIDVATDHRNPQASRIIDINNDGRPEILFEGGKVSKGTDGLYALAIPSNPVIGTWDLTRLTSIGGDGFGVGDIDGDGDPDVTIGRPRNGIVGLSDIKWYENTGSSGLWTGYNVGTTERSADRFEIADIDGDSRPDILISEETYPDFEIPGSAYWFKNPQDPRSTWTRNVIGQYRGYYAPQSMGVADMNSDGKIDVVIGEHQNQKRMFVLLNDGTGHFTENLVGSGKESHGLVVSDIDTDGDYDIINIGWNAYQSLHLWENKAMLTPPITSPLQTVLSDDFNSGTLNTSIWTIMDPKNDSRFTIVGNGTQDALLSIEVPANTSHDVWEMGNYAPRIMQSVSNTNFEIELKFQSQMTSGYQMQGVIVQQDSSNYLRFDFVRDSTETYVFAASFTGDSPTTEYNAAISQGNPLYLRVKRSGNEWMQYYSYDGANWTTAATFNHTLTVTSVGPFVGNHDIPENNSPAFTGLIDYFFNTSSPIVPEDGGIFNFPVISIQPSNQEVGEGITAEFSVVANGTEPLSYQWQKNGVNITGATTATYITPPITLSDNGSTYSVNVTNPAGSVVSDAATLTVIPSLSNNIINPGFESGTASWTFFTDGTGKFSEEDSGYEGKAVELALNSIGTNIQLYQKNIPVEPNTSYRLSFAAYSSRGNDLSVYLIKHDSPYTKYSLSYTADLGTSWQHFTTEFNTTGFTDIDMVDDGRLIFWLAPFAAPGDLYYIDNVRLEKVRV